MPLRICALLLLVLCSAGDAVAQGSDTLSATDDAGRPNWVPAEEAIADGVLRPGPFSVEEFAVLERLVATAIVPSDSDDPCEIVTSAMGSAEGETDPPRSPSAFAAAAETILLGTVRESAQGFLQASPGTLYRLEIDEILAGSLDEARPSGSTIHFFYRSAQISLGDRWLCYYAKRGLERPAVGSRVLLFLDLEGTDSSGILVPLDHQIVFETDAGRFSGPVRYPAPPPTFDEFLSGLRESIGP